MKLNFNIIQYFNLIISQISKNKTKITNDLYFLNLFR